MKRLVYFFVLFLLPIISQARHIVGGEITYKFVSRIGNSNRYEFTMRIYRDCDPSKGGAPLDVNAIIAVFRKNTSSLTDIFTAPLRESRKVGAPEIPCLVPPDVCVEEGTYIFTRDLPVISEPYLIVYQRCCRNRSILNIRNPDAVGATYTIEITPAAQQNGNSSPTFKTFPPTVICNKEPLNYDHSAVDAEGDELVYSFCLPNAGGGRFESRTDCSGPVPNPPCWPVSDIISFIEPNYTYNRPLGGSPEVKIDSKTGTITGLPEIEGQFVVGVCVEEYRNGVLLSVLRRDFQFNVAPCNPSVKAIVAADTIINDIYYLRSCNDKVLTIENKSFERSNITNFFYNIGMEGGVKKFTDWNPTITFPDTGAYRGQLLLNPGTRCADTLDLRFNIFYSIFPDFSMTYDSCNAVPITFTDKSYSKNGKVTNWVWNLGEGNDTLVQNLKYFYNTPGRKQVKLTITDEKKCVETVRKELQWYPSPKLNIFPTNPIGCTPATFIIQNKTAPVDSSYKFKWTYGDGTSTTVFNPVKTFNTPGSYNLTLDVESPTGCKASKFYANYFTVKPGTEADFTYSPERITRAQNEISFTDNSKNADAWSWFFNGKYFSNQKNPTYSARDTGIQKVKLVALNKYGCTDTLIRDIDVIPVITYWLPNAFTPNEDGLNDGFRGTGILDGMRDFKMRILNRWGEMIFETSNPSEFWNGQKYNSGAQSPEGVYLCVVNYNSPRGEPNEIRSYVTLVR